MADGGDVFVLDMGEPVRIVDLARSMIELSGLRVREEGANDGDIAIEDVGLRPGEKLYEELLIGNNPMPSAHPRILRANEPFIAWASLREALDQFDAMIADRDTLAARAFLGKLVVEFEQKSDLTDFVALRREEGVVSG